MLRLPLLFIIAVVLGLTSCQSPQPASLKDGPLILISIDGFRWDYLRRFDVPVLQRLAGKGVHAGRMNASFPTKTFPAHYTLVTGMRPGRHGIVANSFFDPAIGKKFTMANTETHWWAGGEPVWITAEKQGVPTACFFWPGSQTVIQGHRPGLWQPYDRRVTPDQRVDGVLEWLSLPADKRPKLVTLYFEQVDDAGHTFGPEAPETSAALTKVDTAIGRLLAGLARLGLGDGTNLVFVSDHGMTPTSPDRVVFLEDLLDVSQVHVEATGTHAGLRPKPGVDTATLLAELRAKAPAQIQVFRREEMPERFHYRQGDRIPPILLLADLGWNLESKTGWPVRQKTYSKGNHGWDPQTSDMGALFLAHGPAFRSGVRPATVESVDVYNLLCAILGLTPAPNDGGEALLRAALRR